MRVQKTMPENALELQGNFSWGFSEAKKPPARGPPGGPPKKPDAAKDKGKAKVAEEEKKEEEVPEVEKPLKEFLMLKDINVKIKKGEFVCIIGDVGSGKSSLFNAIIGDMIYVPWSEIEGFGGKDRLAKTEEFKKLNEKLLDKDFSFEPPVHVDGSIAYVEQNAWIQNCTIKDNILFN